MAREATLAARRLHEPQAIRNHPDGLARPHPAGSIDPGDVRYRPRVVKVVDMGGFLNRGWELILPGCGGTSALAHGATLAARRLHEPQAIRNHPVRLRVRRPAGRYRPGVSAFSTPGCWSFEDVEGYLFRG